MQLCDYLEEYHTFFTKGRDKLSELMPVIAKYRNRVKEFFDEQSRVESDGESIDEEGEEKVSDGVVPLHEALKVRVRHGVALATHRLNAGRSQ